MTVEIRRGSARFVTREPGRQTRHAFSFGAHYDPERLSFGPLVCHDEHLLGSTAGFETHRHSGLVILSWVVEGVLRHTHDDAAPVDLPAGSLGVLVTGEGVQHSEVAAGVPTRFVQVWLSDPDADTHPLRHAVTTPAAAPAAAHAGPTPHPPATASFWSRGGWAPLCC